MGAAMRRLMQEWIVPKGDETVWDVVFDALMALVGAAIVTQFIQSLLSIL
jgi:hypothetical protein